MKPAQSNHYIKSSANNFSELVMTYKDFNNIKVIPK